MMNNSITSKSLLDSNIRLYIQCWCPNKSWKDCCLGWQVCHTQIETDSETFQIICSKFFSKMAGFKLRTFRAVATRQTSEQLIIWPHLRGIGNVTFFMLGIIATIKKQLYKTFFWLIKKAFETSLAAVFIDALVSSAILITQKTPAGLNWWLL